MTVNRVEHECEKIGESSHVFKDNEKWWLDVFEETMIEINYCPFCGEKLE